MCTELHSDPKPQVGLSSGSGKDAATHGQEAAAGIAWVTLVPRNQCSEHEGRLLSFPGSLPVSGELHAWPTPAKAERAMQPRHYRLSLDRSPKFSSSPTSAEVRTRVMCSPRWLQSPERKHCARGAPQPRVCRHDSREPRTAPRQETCDVSACRPRWTWGREAHVSEQARSGSWGASGTSWGGGRVC